MSQSGDREVGGMFLIAIIAMFGMAVIGAIYMPFLPWNEERQAGEETIERSYDVDQAISNYEEFRDLYNDIQAQRAAVENSEAELQRFYDTWGRTPNEEPEWTRQATERHNQIQTRLTGNRDQLENLIAEYNSMSQQANTELFKCHLPYQVDDRLEIRGPPGSEDAEQPIRDEGPNGTAIDRDANIPDPEQCDGLPDEIQQGATSA